MPPRIPGKLDVAQVYNDSWRGWPVKPLHRQHPIRGSFLDPRPDPELGAIYHDGVDVAVRDATWRARLRARRSLRIRAHRPSCADRRDGRARTAHRLDVQGRLARSSE